LLEQSHHELENILYSVANDFHAQLHVFGPLVEALTRRAGGETVGEPDDLLAVLRTCVQKLGSCLAMLHELRWLRQLDIDTSDVDMTVVVAQVADELSKRYPGTTIEIEALPPLLADRIMVHKIIANLLDNALKYSSKSGSPKVEIGCRVLRDSKTYWIRDNGTGFDPQAAKRIFEPFKRLHADGDYEGKGIGLTIAHRLVERLGGRIWAESRPGQGATFFFTLCEPAAQVTG
jgi:light-regulated signal transduction histidine kinase (bacteriophytochrome)